MNRCALICIWLFYIHLAYGQHANNDYLLLSYDTNRYAGFCYLDKNGDTSIPSGRYLICHTDTFYSTAMVYTPQEGWIMINRKEELLVHVFPFDNGPDYISEGLFRIIEDNLIGYANPEGNIIIKPKFECAFPFHEGYASFCTGGVLINDGEHSWWKDAKWGATDKQGNIIIKPIYDNYFEFNNGKAIVESGNEVFEIDTSGNRTN